MTEATTTIVVAAIAATPPTLVGLVALVVALRGNKTTAEVKQTTVEVKETAVEVKKTLDVLHEQINGHMEKLLEQKGIAAHAEGKAEGVEAERSRPPNS